MGCPHKFHQWNYPARAGWCFNNSNLWCVLPIFGDVIEHVHGQSVIPCWLVHISPFIASNIIKKTTLIHKCKTLKYGIRIKYYSTLKKKNKNNARLFIYEYMYIYNTVYVESSETIHPRLSPLGNILWGYPPSKAMDSAGGRRIHRAWAGHRCLSMIYIYSMYVYCNLKLY